MLSHEQWDKASSSPIIKAAFNEDQRILEWCLSVEKLGKSINPRDVELFFARHLCEKNKLVRPILEAAEQLGLPKTTRFVERAKRRFNFRNWMVRQLVSIPKTRT